MAGGRRVAVGECPVMASDRGRVREEGSGVVGGGEVRNGDEVGRGRRKGEESGDDDE